MDDILNINNVYFDNMVSQICMYPLELHFNMPIPLILKPRFTICICPFLMIIFFLPKFMINMTILILKLYIFHFR